MAQIQISDDVYAELQRAAARAGVSEEAFLEESLFMHIEDAGPFRALTEIEVARMRAGIAQLEQGKGVSMEEVEELFETWRLEIEAR